MFSTTANVNDLAHLGMDKPRPIGFEHAAQVGGCFKKIHTDKRARSQAAPG